MVVRNLWSKSITGSLLNFEEDVEINSSNFFKERVFLSCVFKKNIIISDCLFRNTLAFNSCLFLGKFTIMDSSINYVQFSDNVFKSEIQLLRNKFVKRTNLLDDPQKADANKFDIRPNIQSNVIHWL